eukprot:5137354-Pleurochrysis_carterae.AAC.1
MRAAAVNDKRDVFGVRREVPRVSTGGTRSSRRDQYPCRGRDTKIIRRSVRPCTRAKRLSSRLDIRCRCYWHRARVRCGAVTNANSRRRHVDREAGKECFGRIRPE